MIISDAHQAISARRFIAFFILVSLAVGCSESADEAVARRKKELNIKDEPTAKFSGKVTIDNQTPQLAANQDLLIFLFDPKNPPKAGKPPLFTMVHPDGTFQFYEVPPSSYVVLFAEFRRGRPGVFHGPDALKNLYNDPDKNAAQDAFKITLSPSRKTDHNFNLDVAGKEGVDTPGSQAVTKITRSGRA